MHVAAAAGPSTGHAKGEIADIDWLLHCAGLVAGMRETIGERAALDTVARIVAQARADLARLAPERPRAP